jgi:hypothetical protein
MGGVCAKGTVVGRVAWGKFCSCVREVSRGWPTLDTRRSVLCLRCLNGRSNRYVLEDLRLGI